MDLGSTILIAFAYEVAIANALRSQDFYEQDSQGATDCASFYPSSSVPFQAQVFLKPKGVPSPSSSVPSSISTNLE